MVLIKDLGTSTPKGTKKAVRFGIYECPHCGNHFKART